jgi:hypothetical protein
MWKKILQSFDNWWSAFKSSVTKPSLKAVNLQTSNCENCSFFGGKRRIKDPEEYLGMMKEFDELVKSRKFKIVDQTCGFDEVMSSDGYWYDDVINHTIQCRVCGSSYTCHCDTYHGIGIFY